MTTPIDIQALRDRALAVLADPDAAANDVRTHAHMLALTEEVDRLRLQIRQPLPPEKTEKVERRKARRCTPEDDSLARKCYGRILANNASATAPNFATWGDEIRLMRERDKHTHDQIWTLFDWALSDSFWRRNVLSMGTLREKWNRLTAEMEADKQKADGILAKKPMRPERFDPVAHVNQASSPAKDWFDGLVDIAPRR